MPAPTLSLSGMNAPGNFREGAPAMTRCLEGLELDS